MKLETCVFRLESLDGQPQGTGFVVNPTLAVTCAHVVEECGAGPGELVQLVFQTSGTSMEAQVLTDGWHPKEDVAFLRLYESLPEDIVPATLGASAGQQGMPIHAFGHPGLGKVEGLGADGRFIRQVFEDGQPLLQLRSTQLTVGFSGGPVWIEDTEQVIGMVVQIAMPDRYMRLQDVALAIPTEVLRDLRSEELKLQPTPPAETLTRPPIGIPFLAPPLPPYFVPRPEMSDDIKSRLLASEISAPGVLMISAIHGLGGIGKSVLAAALAHDPDVQRLLPGGVLWVTLGQVPNLLSSLGEWIQALGNVDFRPTTTEAASQQLQTLLHDRELLLVVDDVWQPEHVAPFLVGGPRCRMVITTRRADVVDEVGAVLYTLDVMTPRQALALLASRLGRPLQGKERGEARRLAQAVGYLPLALELAAARVARGITWAALHSALEAEVARLEALEDPRGSRHGRQLRLEASFNLSLEVLRTDDQAAWKAFAWLGVLPEETVLAGPMAATLWDTSPAEAGEILEILWNDALLLSGGSLQVGERLWPSYRLHDLVHDTARRLLAAESPKGMGITLAAAHTTLLSRYKTLCRSDQTGQTLWHTLPDDGYIHGRLIWHLMQAGQTGETHELLAEETSEGRNGWYETREKSGQTAGYLEDVARAWQLAEDSSATALQFRYALVMASFNSMASNIPPDLLVSLVEREQWTPLQGLAYVRQISGERATALVGLAPYLPEALLNEALAAARETPGDWQRAEALIQLAPYLPEALYDDLLAAVREIPDRDSRLYALEDLVLHLPGPQSQDALAAAGEARGRVEHLLATLWLGLHLQEPTKDRSWWGYLPMVKKVWSALMNFPRLGWIALIGLSCILVLRIAVGEAVWEDPRSIVLTLRNIMRDAIPDVPRCIGGLTFAGAMLLLLIGLPMMLMILPAARSWLPGIWVRGAAYLPPKQRLRASQRALAMIREIESEDQRALCLKILAPYLPEALMPNALALVLEVQDQWHRTRSLTALVPHLPEHLLDEALRAAEQITEERYRATVLEELAPFLSEPLLGKALDIVRDIRDQHKRTVAVAGLVPYVPESLLTKALAAAQAIRDEDERTWALLRLTPYLPKQLKEAGARQILAAARDMGDVVRRSWVLVLSAACLPESLSDQALQYGLASAQASGDSTVKALLLEGLATYLPVDRLTEALDMAAGIHSASDRAYALTALAADLPEPMKHNALDQALTAVEEIASASLRAERLIELIPQLPDGPKEAAVRQAFATVQGIKGDRRDAHLLIQLLPHLTESLKDRGLEQALDAAGAVKSKEYQMRLMVDLVPFLPERGRDRIPSQARVIDELMQKRKWRTYILPRLASHVPELVSAETLVKVFAEALSAVRRTENDHRQAKDLQALFPWLPEQLLVEALVSTREIESERWRAETLSKLIPYLPDALLPEALAAASEIENVYDRSGVLVTISPRLVDLPAYNLGWLSRETAHALSVRTRRALLEDLPLVVPILVAAGGAEAVWDLFKAIQDVGRWWP